MLSEKHAEWIVKRKQRWAILFALKNGEISVIAAEKKLRKLDAE